MTSLLDLTNKLAVEEGRETVEVLPEIIRELLMDIIIPCLVFDKNKETDIDKE